MDDFLWDAWDVIKSILAVVFILAVLFGCIVGSMEWFCVVPLLIVASIVFAFVWAFWESWAQLNDVV